MAAEAAPFDKPPYASGGMRVCGAGVELLGVPGIWGSSSSSSSLKGDKG